MDAVIGIDLGTTNSVVATVQDGAPIVIPSRNGYFLTPSVVALSNNGKRLVGALARRQAVTNAERTVVAVKRIMGRKFSSAAVQQTRARMPYEITCGEHDDPRVKLGDVSFSPPEISAVVLSELRHDAEAYLGEPVTKAVITVPAYFNDAQRTATKDAGRIAGLEVLRIINEPTSAALAYGFGRAPADKQLAVFDLGGGTFDFSLLRMYEGVFEVEATGGDSMLGGEDFDQRIVDWLAEGFASKHKIDLRKDRMSLQRLRDAAEKAKCELSSLRSADVNLPFVAASPQSGPLHLQATLTRETLELLTRDLVERTLRVCAEVLAEAKLAPHQIGDVLLVGGQTRMPKIQDAVRTLFQRDPSKSVNPDEAVAVGAAIQGAMLTHKASEMLLLDVTPHSLGIAIAGGFFQKIIPRNTTVPTTAHHVFTTVKDNQTSAKISVAQGESELAAQNELLGEFMLTGLRQAVRGGVDIDVIFDISADGIVAVSAIDVSTGLRQSITVTATSGLTPEELARATQANQEYLLGQKEDPSLGGRRPEAEALLKQFDELLPRVARVKSWMNQEPVHMTEAAAASVRLHLAAKDAAGLAVSNERLGRLLSALRGALDRAGAGTGSVSGGGSGAGPKRGGA